jgi:hypothetical protein
MANDKIQEIASMCQECEEHDGWLDPEEVANAVSVRNSAVMTGSTMPWNRSELIGWDVVGLNHYYVNGVRYLFCIMAKDNNSIAEGGYENEVFDELARKALAMNPGIGKPAKLIRGSCA